MSKPKKLMGVQQNLLDCDKATLAVVIYLCEQSNSLYNCGTY
jgi:putative transposase